MFVYKSTDRVPVEIKGIDSDGNEHRIEFLVAPMTQKHRTEILDEIAIKAGVEIGNRLESAQKAMKYCVKDVKGLDYMDGTSFECRFDDHGYLTDECVEELANCSVAMELTLFCSQLTRGIRDYGIAGVEVKFPKTKKKTRKAKTQ